MKINYILFFLFSLSLRTQNAQIIHSYRLDNKLKEISGLESINDSLLVAHNDGGNDPTIYVLNQKGKILKTCFVYNVKNIDWEDITKDNQGNLYIGDIGNNSNKRKSLRILKIRTFDILNQDSVSAEIYSLKYPEQTEYPPNQNELYFDAESLAFYNDSLWIFTKCRTKPFDGKSFVYAAELKQITIDSFKKVGQIVPGKKNWAKDSFTSATAYDEFFYLITYNRLIKITRKENQFTINNIKRFKKYNQRESIAFSNKHYFVANENHWLFGKQRLNVYRHE